MLAGPWRSLLWTLAMSWAAAVKVVAELKNGDADSSLDLASKGRLRITTIEVEPYMMVARRPPGLAVNSTSLTQSEVVGRFYGYLPDLLEALATTLNFQYDLYMVPDGSYGYRKGADRWSGMIGELLKGKADLAAGPLLMTENRRDVIDFTTPFLMTQATLLLRRPPSGVDLRIRNLNDLLNQSEIKYGTLRKGIIPRSFRRTNDSLLRVVWRNMLRFGSSVFTVTNEEGIDRVRRDKFAFILPDTIGEYIAMRQPCDFLTVGTFLMKTGYGLALRKNSGYVDQFNRGLKTLGKSGFLDRLKNRWWAGRSECNGIRTGKVYSLNGAESVQRSMQSELVSSFFAYSSTILIAQVIFRGSS